MDVGSLQGIVKRNQEGYRKSLRFPLSIQADCIYNVAETAVRCRIVDISNQGLGFELDIPGRMQSGQLVLLAIDIPSREKSVSAIARLAWVRNHTDGRMGQRVGGRLLFIDPQGKEQLMEQAYAGVLLKISRVRRFFST